MNFTNFFSNINPKEVITNLPDAVFVVDNDGKVVWTNNKAFIIFESNSGGIKGMNFDELVANGLELAHKSYTTKTPVVTGGFTLEGKEIFIEMNVKKYGEQYFITIRDVTAMTNVLTIAERTGRLNKEKNVMFVKLSNEFKSPVQSIMGFSQALLDGMGGDITEKQEKYVKIINKNSSELLYFIDKFLEFAQAESSLFNCENKYFNIVNALQTIVKNNESSINSKDIKINIDVDDFNKKAVYNDENIIKIILQNIIETSIQLTDAGNINIKIDHPEMDTIQRSGAKIFEGANSSNYIRITITDTGIGLADSELEGIFEPYTQLDKGRKKTILRSIALGSAHTMLKRMGGALGIKSEVMKGATFTVIIPTEKQEQV